MAAPRDIAVEELPVEELRRLLGEVARLRAENAALREEIARINDPRRKRRGILASIPRVRRQRRGMRPEEIQWLLSADAKLHTMSGGAAHDRRGGSVPLGLLPEGPT